jgi:hypothetical protein
VSLQVEHINSTNCRFELLNVERAPETDFDGKQSVLWPHPHSEQLADTFHLWIIANNLLHVANAGTVGPLSHEESAGFTTEEYGDERQEDPR